MVWENKYNPGKNKPGDTKVQTIFLFKPIHTISGKTVWLEKARIAYTFEQRVSKEAAYLYEYKWVPTRILIPRSKGEWEPILRKRGIFND